MMVRRLLSRLRRDDRGFTLVELMVVSVMLIVILGAIAGLATTAERMAPTDNEGSLQLREAQTGLDGMVRELRAAHAVTAVSDYVIEADVVQRRTGAASRVRYDCSLAHPTLAGARRCVRQVLVGGVASGAQPVVVDRIVNQTVPKAVFTPTVRDGRVSYVSVAVIVPGGGERTGGPSFRTTLEDGLYLRNVDVLR
jgi:Tfp pilus assembly protein PilX